MGRETKILLGMLATLTGVFVGVLSMKLLVPRPPAGAGPDVHVELAATEPHLLVTPPDLSASTSAFEPTMLDRQPSEADELSGNDMATMPAHVPPVERPLFRRDPFVTAASLDQPLRGDEATASRPAGPAVSSGGSTDAARLPNGSAQPGYGDVIERRMPPADLPPAILPPPGPAPAAPSFTHAVVAGDSWWNLAERAYGDGRLYRALFAWNRMVDQRVSLTPGTRLEIPSRDRLEAAWPKLVPPQ